jgi:putative selenium metabolism hydrolase
MKDKIYELAESYRDEVVQLLREAVAIPSLDGKEGPIIERLARAMQELDYDEVWVDGMGNLLGRIGSGDRLIAIDGHCDTVDVGNPDIWEVDPFGGVYRDGIVYGRGAVDQKGGLVSAICSGKIIKEIGLPADVSLLVVASVYEEDAEGLNWQYIIKEDGIHPEAVVLTEPTNLKICRGQRGRVELKVKTQGISCHGSAPDRGDNAIYKASPIIQDIERLHRRLESDSVLGKGTVTVTDIRSTAPSLCAVADSCTIHLDRRLTEGETRESVLEEVKQLPSVLTAGAQVWVHQYDIRAYTGLPLKADSYCPAWLMDPSDPLIQTAIRAYEKQFDEKATVGVWQFSTNGVATKGIHNIPSVGFGPGTEEHAHTPMDQVRADDLVKAMAFYTAFVCSLRDYSSLRG